MNKYEQAEKIILLAREHKLDAEGYSSQQYRVGSRWFRDPISVTVALLSAFDKVGIKVPTEIRARPTGID